MAKEGREDKKNFVGMCERHIVSSLHGKATPFSMWKALKDLFQSSSDHRKLALKDKLRKIKMEKNETILVYFKKFFQCRYELGSVGFSVVNDELVILTLFGLPNIWHNYKYFVYGWEKLPDWERLWSDLV